MEDEANEVYETFWKDLIETDGIIDMQAVKNELYDYHVMMGEVSKVYDDVTGGRMAKPNTAAHHIITRVNERINEAYEKGYSDAKEELS